MAVTTSLGQHTCLQGGEEAGEAEEEEAWASTEAGGLVVAVEVAGRDLPLPLSFLFSTYGFVCLCCPLAICRYVLQCQ